MFKFFKKKQINADNIKWFDRALSAIKTFIFIEEWENAYNAIVEIKEKERKGYEWLIKNLSDSHEIDLKQKEKHTNIYEKRIKKLNSLKELAEKKETKFKKNIENKRFKIRFAKIKSEIVTLSKSNKNSQALNLLTNFLEENKDKQKVIQFFNKEKKFILKNMDKQRKNEESKIKNNANLEAMRLMWETLNIEPESKKEDKKSKKNKGGIFNLFEKFNFYKKTKEKLKKKKMLDEINLLIEEDSNIKNDIASKKLANMHKWLVKEISNEKMLWYDFFWKILWADKISWDSFWLSESKEKYSFFLWDATWHGIRAWFIVTLLTRLFNDFVKKVNLQELCLEINNGLKQNLKNRNFITWIFFEIIKKDVSKIKYVWMWHEPMLIYKSKTRTVERVLPWWLAAGIRIIKNKDDVKTKEIELENHDILVIYSDWIIENKNSEWDFYWIEWLEKQIKKSFELEPDIKNAYAHIMSNVTLFKWWSSFEDDSTLLIIKRNTNKDILEEENEFIKELSLKEWLDNKQKKKLLWKTKDEIGQEIEKIKKEKELKHIIKNLETLYYTWEVLKLKQEAIRFIKKGYLDKKINYFLKKAIANESSYKIKNKNQKMLSKYNVLSELYKKWDYGTVIQETENIIAKDWNI